MREQANILIVDDTPENLRLLSNMLAAAGYKVRAVTSGARAHRPACIPARCSRRRPSGSGRRRRAPRPGRVAAA